jgi:hypothetical protein
VASIAAASQHIHNATSPTPPTRPSVCKKFSKYMRIYDYPMGGFVPLALEAHGALDTRLADILADMPTGPRATITTSVPASISASRASPSRCARRARTEVLLYTPYFFLLKNERASLESR